MKINYGPREKLSKFGIKSLSDEELLAILIKTGTKDESVLDLSRRILKDIQNLNILNDYSYEELMQYKGLGMAKSMTIVSAIELGNRIRYEKYNRKTIRSVRDEVDYLKNDFIGLTNEKIVVVFLTINNHILSKRIFDSTETNKIFLNTKEIIKTAIKLNSLSVIIAHNHPDGSCEPSIQDIKAISNLKERLDSVDIDVFDSLIFTDREYYSMVFSDEPKPI